MKVFDLRTSPPPRLVDFDSFFPSRWGTNGESGEWKRNLNFLVLDGWSDEDDRCTSELVTSVFEDGSSVFICPSGTDWLSVLVLAGCFRSKADARKNCAFKDFPEDWSTTMFSKGNINLTCWITVWRPRKTAEVAMELVADRLFPS